ncbi:MAG: choice-of-anchor J domain-containing protein [Bacteroidales bacterium]
MKKNLLFILFMSLLWLSPLPATPSSPMSKDGSKIEHARKVKCLTISSTGHFEALHPKSLREIMEAFGGVEYTYTKDVKSLSLEKLLEYDVVWVYNFSSWEDIGVTGVEVSNLLGAYVKAGGYLLEAMHLQEMDPVAKIGLLGGTYMNENLSPFKPAMALAAGSINMGEVSHPEHPIMNKVKTINVTHPTYLNEAKADAMTLAYFEETKAPLVSVYKNIVAVNIAPVDVSMIAGVQTFVFGDGHRLLYNAIKWLFSNKYDTLAPDQVTDLEVKPLPSSVASQFNIGLTWKNPSYLINGAPLTNFTAIAIYRDSVLVKTIDKPIQGAELSWVDENVPTGSHIYKIIALDGKKQGYPNSVKTYSGRDIPAAVHAITLAPKGNGGYLAWKMDKNGKNNGWVDTSTLTYKIVRQPGNITVATAHTTNSFTDNTIPSKKRYSYEITPSTVDGVGAMQKSGEMYLYTNGDIYMGTSRVMTCDGKFYGPEGPNTDYKENTVYVLSIAPENPETGKRIQVSFKKMDISLLVGGTDELHIFDGPSIESKPIPGSPFGGQQIPAILANLRAGVANTSGALTFGFISGDFNVGKGWEADISCVQLPDKDLAGVSVQGEKLPKIGETYTYQTIIKNEGLVAQSNFEVKFFAGATQSTRTISESLAPGDTMHIDFTWTPTIVAQTPLGVSVSLVGDDSTHNNVSPMYMVAVQTATTVHSEITSTVDLATMFVPLNFFYKSSVSQSIYLKKEINLAKGKITAIRYFSGFSNEVSNEKVIIHIMETPKTDLSAGWMPVAKMKKVYEGVVNFPFGKNEITLVLDSTFDYKGGNLVIRAEHPMSQYQYTIAEAFQVIYDNQSRYRSLFYGSSETAFDEKTSLPTNANYYPCVVFAMDVKEAASLKGRITSKELPMDSVKVQVKGTPYYAMSNAKGEYCLPSLNEGTDTVVYSKYSYITLELPGIVLQNGKVTLKDVSIKEIPKAIITGTVLDNAGDPIANACVELQGYDHYTTQTLANGTFTLKKVYTDQKYEILLTKDRFTPYKGKLAFGANDTNIGTLTMVQIAYPPLCLTANENASKSVQLTWKDPADMNFTRLTYDNGEATFTLGVKPEIEGWFGTAFSVEDSGLIESIDIFGVPHPMLEDGNLGNRYVTVDIFDSKRKKVATSKPFLMPEEKWINVPLGFFPYKGVFYAMVHFPPMGETDFGNTIGGDAFGPNANNQSNYFSDGYAWGVVQSIANVDPFVFMIRANVFTEDKIAQLKPEFSNKENYDRTKIFSAQGKKQASSAIETSTLNAEEAVVAPVLAKGNPFAKSFPAKYSVYSFLKNQKDKPTEWTLLTANHIAEKSYIDHSFANLPQGSYCYAVKANYTSELISEPAFSEVLHKDMVTTLYLEGRTNTSNNPIENAQIRLVNMDTIGEYVYTGNLDANGKLKLSGIWKGKYALTVSKLGFVSKDTSGIMLTTDSAYKVSVVLEQDRRAPYNLEIAPKEGGKGAYSFVWNESKNIEEGFESHVDFTLNSSGKIGWNYSDYDKSHTYSIQGFKFPNEGELMAYIIFNPSQTTPKMESLEAMPYKGKKYLASFAAAEEKPNDDWFISPKLNYTNEFTFSFWARSFSSSNGLEKIQVGYSSNSKDSADFIWIQGEQALTLPTKWAEYSYQIPGFAKYVAIRNVSFNSYLLMIDEVFIGNEKTGETGIKGFKVYLDGKEVAQTQTKEYTFRNISNPENHKAGVQAFYETGVSSISEIGFNPLNAEEDLFAKSLSVYPNPAQNYIILEGLTQSGTYEIYNMYGSLLKTKMVSNAIEQIAISDLSSGSYVIRIITKEATAVKRFIKK